MPRNIVLFERLMYASIAIGLAIAILGGLSVAAVSGGAGLLFAVLVGSLTLLFMVLLIWLTARRRKNWTRWVLLIFTVAGFFMAYPQLSQALRTAPLVGGLQLVQILLQIAALWFVFTGDAKDWFRKRTTPEAAA